MQLDWYIKRLKSMSLSEITHRVSERVTIYQEKAALKKRPPSDHKILTAQLSSEWGFQLPDSNAPTNLEATLHVADQLLANKIELFGQLLDLESPVNWHRDPLTKNEWSQDFHANIDKRDGKKIGGCKWVWELNRHHHLVTLAKAFYLTKDERYSEAVCHQIKSWIDTNNYLHGINWTSSLELALRVINWTWALSFIRHSNHLTDELLESIIASINLQCEYVERHLSAHSSANNHLIGEVAGLGVVGFAFPFLPKSTKWKKLSTSVLERELPLQIHPDGVTAEQASSYLAFVLDFNLMVWLLAENAGHEIPAVWYQRLGVACDFIAHVIDKNGNVPAIGDSDGAWVARLDDRAGANNYQSILATAAVILNRPDLKAYSAGWDEKSHWLLGQSGKQVLDDLEIVESSRKSQHFRMGGYCTLRSERVVGVFDCGELGYLSTAAHGHADALSLWLSVDGRPMLVDPGTYAYQEGYEWRDYFRSTLAHNTITIDGENQSEIQGQFLWGRKAKTQLRKWESNDQYDFAIADHDGYEHKNVGHQRILFYEKQSDIIVIVDRLEGNSQHNWQQCWHFSPTTNYHLIKNRCIVEDSGTKICLVLDNEQVTVCTGEKDPIRGWFSADYGQIEPSNLLIVSGSGKLPQELKTIIDLAPDTQDFSARKTIAMEKLDLLITRWQPA